jgi:hypothetical protein
MRPCDTSPFVLQFKKMMKSPGLQLTPLLVTHKKMDAK